MDPDCIEVMLPNDSPGPSGHIPNIAMAIDPTYPRAHYKSYSHDNPSNTTSPILSLPPPGRCILLLLLLLKQAHSRSPPLLRHAQSTHNLLHYLLTF